MDNDLFDFWSQGARPKLHQAAPLTTKDARFHTLNGPPNDTVLPCADAPTFVDPDILKSESTSTIGRVGVGGAASKPPTIVPRPSSDMSQLITAFTEGI